MLSGGDEWLSSSMPVKSSRSLAFIGFGTSRRTSARAMRLRSFEAAAFPPARIAAQFHLSCSSPMRPTDIIRLATDVNRRNHRSDRRASMSRYPPYGGCSVEPVAHCSAVLAGCSVCCGAHDR
jgi:hypothetical protein